MKHDQAKSVTINISLCEECEVDYTVNNVQVSDKAISERTTCASYTASGDDGVFKEDDDIIRMYKIDRNAKTNKNTHWGIIGVYDKDLRDEILCLLNKQTSNVEANFNDDSSIKQKFWSAFTLLTNDKYFCIGTTDNPDIAKDWQNNEDFILKETFV